MDRKNMDRKNIVLIGFMGTGKSTISSRLKDRLTMKEIDTDALIVEREGMSISDIFAEKGEEAFRNMETELLRELKNERNLIVSCGGGMALRDTNAAIMKAAGTVVWLTAAPETILERVKYDDSRPLLRGNKNTKFIGDLLEKRRPKYEAAADVTVATDGRSVDDICDEIIRKLS
jgi:shikimate kinase